MFSHRVPGSQAVNRLSRAVAERRARGGVMLDLTESNPTQCGFLYDEAGITGSLAGPGVMLYEPHPQGLLSAREAVAEYYAAQGLAVDPGSLFLASGTSEAYAHLFKLLADPGEEILVPTPGYPLLEVLAGLDAVRQVPYRLSHEQDAGWSIDAARLRDNVSTRTRAIVVVSPNNPTGSYLKRGELAAIAAICRDHALALIVDEVFSDYGRGADPERVQSAAGHVGALTFVLNGLSKLSGLPQMKLAWICVSGPDQVAAQARERLAWIADAYLSVGASVQHAARPLLAQRTRLQEQIRHRLAVNDAVLETALRGIPSCRVLAREGGWYGVIQLPPDTAEEELSLGLVERDGILAHPGYFYDFTGGAFLVVSLLTRVETFREGVTGIAKRIRSSAA